MSKRTLYVPLVVDYFRDFRIIEIADVSPWCEVLWTRLLCQVKASGSDGVVTRPIALSCGVPQWQKWIAVLVRVGLLNEADGGWVVPAWTKHNLTMDQVEQKRSEVAERVRKHRSNGGTTQPVTESPVVTLLDSSACNALHGALHRDKEEGISTPKGVSSSPQASKRANPVFDAVAESLTASGLSPDIPAFGGLASEIAKRVRSSGRSADFVTRFALWLASADGVDLTTCTAKERSRVLGAVGQIARVTDDRAEIARRLANCRATHPRSPAQALADNWSKFDGTPTATTAPGARATVVDRNEDVLARGRAAFAAMTPPQPPTPAALIGAQP